MNTRQDTERSPNLAINRLPSEVLLEVFDSYRQSIEDSKYEHQWRKKHGWFNIAHVCRRWRAVAFSSSSRLDINIVMGPEKPGHIKKTLSGHLPILINYHPSLSPDGRPRNITGSALWRMRAALSHRDRVRGIWFEGWCVNSFEKFLSAANYYFPALESLVLRIPLDRERVVPATFLKGLDQLDLPLQHLRLSGGSLPSVSGLLLSATALTDLTLEIPSKPTVLDPSQESVLLACLKGMQCLRSLHLTTSHLPDSQRPTPKDIALLQLTRFHFFGPTRLLNNLMSELQAPSLQDIRFGLYNMSPLLYLPRVIDNVREEFRSVSVNFSMNSFCLSSSTHSGTTDHFKPSFSFDVNHFPYSIDAVNRTPSTKLAMAEELAFNCPSLWTTNWGHVFSLREFLRQFRSVRVLRVNPFRFAREVGRYLQQDDGEVILPLLEEIELSDGECKRHAAEAMATLEPFASARERAGSLVKVYHS